MANGVEAPTQEGHLLKITTPLGEDYLLLQSVELVEEISRIPRAECVVLHHETEDGPVPTVLVPEELLGQAVTLQFWTEDETTRYFNGIVNRVTQGDRDLHNTAYSISVVPSMWMLTQKRNSRIFQHVTVEQILEQVLAGHPFQAQLGSLELKPRNYVVQYRETDFDFISRLMEEEGIFYYFTHTEEQHKMMLCVDPQHHVELESLPQIPYQLSREGEGFTASIGKLETNYNLRTGNVTLWDYTFQKPKDNFVLTQPTRFDKFATNKDAEIYNFPAGSARKHDIVDAGGGDRGSELTNISDDIRRNVEFQQQVIDAKVRVLTAESNVVSLVSGHRFKLTTHPTDEMNTNYVITRVVHTATQSPKYYSDEAGEGYKNRFECIKWGEGAAPFRPERKTPKPMILTSQTATVVGPQGEEIYTDKFGRVKVQFHWDREGSFDQGSSCWARISQQWAGNNWGSMFIPRIGMEVLVHFLEGDADQPIITGCVYNQDAMPPYTLPDEKTKSGVKSDSSKGGQGFNEWRFEDKKGEEQIFLHGEKDWDRRVKNDVREWTGGDQHLIVVGDHLEQVDGSQSLKVAGDQKVKIDGGHHLKVGGDEAIDIGGTQTVKVGGSQGINVSSGHSTEAMTVYIKGTTNVVIEAGVQLSLKGSGGFIDIGPAGVSIVGNLVNINSGGGAGSGTAVGACPPTAPDAPDEADNDKPGKKMELLERSKKRKENKSSKDDPTKKSYIELEMLTEAGEPCAGERYLVVTSDGKKKNGSLNNKGFARINGIEPGNCKVTFPNLDKEAWKDA